MISLRKRTYLSDLIRNNQQFKKYPLHLSFKLSSYFFLKVTVWNHLKRWHNKTILMPKKKAISFYTTTTEIHCNLPHICSFFMWCCLKPVFMRILVISGHHYWPEVLNWFNLLYRSISVYKYLVRKKLWS